MDSFLDTEMMETFLNYVKGGNVKESTMRTYVTNFRYVLQFIAARDNLRPSSIPMASFLSNRCYHYQRAITRAQSDKSWQVLDSAKQWIHW